MPHQDLSGVDRLHSRHLAQALQSLLGGVDWAAVRFQQDCTWTPRLLVWAALLWAWSDETTLGERFTAARRIVLHLTGESRVLAGSTQAFMKLLARWTGVLVCLVKQAWRERMQDSLPDQWRIGGLIVFGVDGSRIELPRTASHEGAYSPCPRRSGKRKRHRRKRPHDAAYTKKANVPQIWLTTLFHVGTGLLWNWRTGPSDSSEREQALSMLPSLPAGALLTADAGSWATTSSAGS